MNGGPEILMLGKTSMRLLFPQVPQKPLALIPISFCEQQEPVPVRCPYGLSSPNFS